jgi:hypothetical protein
MAKKRSWGLIILGIVIFVVIVGVAALGTAGYLFYRQFNVQTATTANPEPDFAKIEARFAGQIPLIELPEDDEDTPKINRPTPSPGAEVAPISDIHVMAWSKRDGKLVNFTMPFWLIRLSGNKPIQFNTTGNDSIFGTAHVQLTAEDVERRGPGLIFRRTGKRGERVLIWAE